MSKRELFSMMIFSWEITNFPRPTRVGKGSFPVADHTWGFQFSKESLQVANSNDKAEGSY